MSLHRANPRIRDAEGRTPIHWACHNKSVKALEALLAHGGLVMNDVNAGDASGMTACMWACFYDSAVSSLVSPSCYSHVIKWHVNYTFCFTTELFQEQ